MKKSIKSLIKIAALPVLAPMSAMGQTSPPPPVGMDTITVTAQKRAESIQEVPLSIIAVQGDILEERNVTTATELGKVVSTLQINNGLFSSGVTIRIRGFGTAANTAVDSDVAAYLDGAFVPRPGAILGSFLDVKTVEVLSGPQGTLFGRNAALGAISFNTNSPSRKQEFEGKIEGGSFKTFNGSVVGNLPLNEQFAVRFAAKGATTDGVFNNAFDGKTYGARKESIGRVSLRWDISPDATWTVRLDSAKIDGDGLYPLTVYSKTASDTQLASLASFVTRNGGTPPIFTGQPGYTINQVAKDPKLIDKQSGIISDVGWDITPNLTTRLINSYRDWDSKQLSADTLGTTIDLLNINTNTRSKAQSHEVQLNTPKGAFLGNKLGFTSGLYYFKEDFSIDQSFNLGSRFCQVIFGARPQTAALVAPCQAAPGVGAGLDTFVQSVKSTAAYVSGTYALVPGLDLDLGVRTTKDEKSATFVSTAPNRIGIGAVVTPEGPYDLKFDDKNTSWRSSLSWHPSQQVLLFGTYQTGYKSGGFNAGAFSTIVLPPVRTFQSEDVKDLELGIKAIFANRFLVNVTLFDTKLKNFQDRSFNGTGFFVRNAGDVRSKGVDIDGQVRIVQPLLFKYGATYLDSTYEKNPNALGLEGCTGGATGCPTVQDLSGKTLPYAPKWRGNVGLEWDSAVFMGGYKTTAAISENFTTSFLTSATNNPQSRVSGYGTADIRVSLFAPGKTWQFDVFGSNIFDKGYYTATVAQALGGLLGVTNATTGATVFRGFLGDPRRFGVRLTFKF